MSKKQDVICLYCGGKARLAKGAEIYARSPSLTLRYANFWLCDNPEHEKAYVGCHKGTSVPLGRLADAELRQAKSRAHLAFDPLWRDKHMSRTKAYVWLSKTLEIARVQCHIGMFDLNLCERTVTVCRRKMAELDFGD